MSQQYPLDLAPEPINTFENFQIGKSNEQAFKAVSSFPNWPIPNLLLIAPQGAGKTHLGRAWADKFDNVVFVDDAELVDDMQLFAALNRALNGEVEGCLLTSSLFPQDWNVQLPDLNSRLKNCPIVHMDDPEDDILDPITRKLFQDKGRDIRIDVVAFILKNFERSIPQISQLIDELDQAASEQKKDITLSLIHI